MTFDFQTISPLEWRAIEAVTVIGGALIGFLLSLLLRNASFSIVSSKGQTFSGGCLVPVLVGMMAAIGFARLSPDCSQCGFTPDATFVPLVIFPLISLSASAAFFLVIWRR